jgi:hypothetical protein
VRVSTCCLAMSVSVGLVFMLDRLLTAATVTVIPVFGALRALAWAEALETPLSPVATGVIATCITPAWTVCAWSIVMYAAKLC